MKQKLEQFVRYELAKAAMITCLMAIVALLIWHFVFRPRQQVALHVLILSDSLEEEGLKQLREELAADLGVSERDIIIDDGYDRDRDAMLIEALFFENDMDAMIAPEEDFKVFAGEGAFWPLDERLTKREKTVFAKEAVVCNGFDEDAGVDEEGNESGYNRGVRKAYGMRLDKMMRYRNASMGGDGFVYGIIAQSEHKGAAQKLLSLFLESYRGER